MEPYVPLLVSLAVVGWTWWLNEWLMRRTWQRMANDWKDLCEQFATKLGDGREDDR